MQKNKILPGYSKSLTTSLDHRGGLARSTNKLRPDRSLFDCIGGREVVARIVDGLYDRIAADRELRRIFTGDLHREREVQKAFFEEWLGGDPLFSRNYAYSGLALRHRGVHITRESALRWLNHLTGSLEETEISKTLVKSSST